MDIERDRHEGDHRDPQLSQVVESADRINQTAAMRFCKRAHMHLIKHTLCRRRHRKVLISPFEGAVVVDDTVEVAVAITNKKLSAWIVAIDTLIHNMVHADVH